MLLTCDKQLLRKFSGTVDESLEEAIVKLNDGCCEEDHTNLWGNTLALDTFLVNEEMASNIVFSTAREQWRRVDLLTIDYLRSLHIDADGIHDHLDDFFYSPKGKRAMMEHLVLHHQFTFEHLIARLYDKDAKGTKALTGLRSIHLYKINDRYFVHPIFEEHNAFWEWLFAKKIYSLFMHMPIEELGNIYTLLIHLEKSMLNAYPHVDNFPQKFIEVLDKCITYVDKRNGDSIEKKELFLQQLVAHFRITNGHDKQVGELASSILDRWLNGDFAITEKEQVVIAYIQFVFSQKCNDKENMIKHGRYLLERERLNNHGVEIMLEYEGVLLNRKPTPHVLVKHYEANYLEYIFYEMIHALVSKGYYKEALIYIKEFEMASCESIYRYVNGETDENSLHLIEATVQQDIAFIVDNSLQYISASLDIWRTSYQNEESDYYVIAEMTSRHMCNLMKVFFVTEQFALLEKLMETYKKYLMIECHFEEMRQFMATYV